MSSKRFIVVLTAIVGMLICQQMPVSAAEPVGKKKGQEKHQLLKAKKVGTKKADRKVLYCEGADADEKIASAQKNYQLAMEMLKKAQDAGHVIQDENGLYVKKCGDDCDCLPIVPSAVKPTK